MLLAVDAGNTKIKAAVFEGAELLEKFSFDKEEADKFLKIFSCYPLIAHSVLAEVGNPPEEVVSLLEEKTALTMIHRSLGFPFRNKYETPQTLGIDRMVLAAGAALKYPAQNCLVIDAGTCVTYDFLAANGDYLGGAISPGIKLRYEAMHNFTAKLPLLSVEMPEGYIGTSTAGSMHSGVVNGLLSEIEGFVSRYGSDYGNLVTILTGGDAYFLAKRLKNTIFANSNFLLESLSVLYQYLIEND